MAISKIKTGSITDSAVNTNKLAPGSVGSTDISTDLVTGLTELSETAADTDYTLIYDTSSGTIKKVLRSNLKQSGPTISSISPTNANDSEATVTFTITGTGFTAGSNARFIDTNGKITEFATVTRNSTTQITATIAASNLSANNDPYDVQVINGEGIASILTSQVNFNATPTFITASGSLGSGRTSMSGVSVNATDPDSEGVVTFELISGSLPAGITLVNSSANGGTATFTGSFDTPESSDTVYNFTLRASDVSSGTSTRAFSFTALGPAYQSFTSSGTFSVPSGITAVDVLVVAGAGGGGGGGGRAGPPGDNGTGAGGGGAGGLIYRPAFPVTPGGTISVTVGCGGGASTTGQDSVFGTLTAKGGGGGGSGPGGQGSDGGSGGGTAGAIGGGGPGSTATQPTQPGDSGTYGFGNGGGGSTQGDWQDGGAGGGGAGAAAQTATGFAGTAGGAGRAYTIADGTTPVYYAGGGGGGGGHTGGGGSTPAPGGQGGGGAGGAAIGGSGQNGQANKGGGGGGGAQSPGGTSGSSGGKGIVIVAY